MDLDPDTLAQLGYGDVDAALQVYQDLRAAQRREADAVRHHERRATLARLRAAEGIEERSCDCGCGRVFPVEHKRGRPRRYATVECQWRALKRAARERVLSIASALSA